MSETYTVLRDMAQTSSEEPFRARAEAFVAAAPPATRLDRAELTKREVRDLVRAPEVQAVAPVMPTSLIRPVPADDGSPAAADPAPDGVAGEPPG